MEEDQKQKSPEKNLKIGTIIFMTAVGGLYDLLQIAFVWAGIGWALIPIFLLHFYVWFKLHGVRFFTMKKIWTMIAGMTLEVGTAGVAPTFAFIVFKTAMEYEVGKIAPVLDIIKK